MQYLQPRGAGVRFPKCFQIVSTWSYPFFNKSSFFVKLLFTGTAHFIQGLYGLSEPFKTKLSKESIAKLNIGVSLCIFVYIADRDCMERLHGNPTKAGDLTYMGSPTSIWRGPNLHFRVNSLFYLFPGV